MEVSFCVSGRGTLAMLAIRHAKILGIEIGSVLLDLRASSQTEAELNGMGVDVIRLRSATSDSIMEQVIDFFDNRDSAIWMLTFDRLLPATVVKPRLGRILNVHMALLPAFRGMDGIGQTLRSGARFAGATIHEIDERMDEGHIISQFVTEVLPSDSVDSLRERIFVSLAPMYAQCLSWYAQRRIWRDDKGGPYVREAQFNGGPTSPALEFAGLEFARRTNLGSR